MTASIPSAHLRVDKTRSIASRKIDLADLHHAVTRRVHDGSRSARLVLGRLKFNLTDGAYRNYRTAAIADFYRCGLRREALGDDAAQNAHGPPFLPVKIASSSWRCCGFAASST